MTMKIGNRRDYLLAFFGCIVLAILFFVTALLGDKYGTGIKINGRYYHRSDAMFRSELSKIRTAFCCASVGFCILGYVIWRSQLRGRPRIDGGAGHKR